MKWSAEPVESLPRQIWQALAAACAGAGDPFRFPALATAGASGGAARTVVLRQADAEQRLLICYSDLRAQKVRQIQACPQVEWLFLDLHEKVQIRARARATVHYHDALAKAEWEATPATNRANYSFRAAPRSESGVGERVGSDEEAFENFSVLLTVVESFDWLELHPEGNRRAVCRWTGREWRCQWVVP